MKDIKLSMFNLIKEEVCPDFCQGNTSLREGFTEEELLALFELADSLDLAHIVCATLEKKQMLNGDKAYQKFNKKLILAKYRYLMFQTAFEQICSILEEAKVYFIPLKGAVIRKYYPQAYLRTSCDIDLLIKEEDLEKVLEILSQKDGYKIQKKQSHDVAVISPNNTCIELHYKLIEDDVIDKMDQPLLSVWESAVYSDGKFKCSMSNELFYYYHLTHMAKHFLIGGCGVRPFLDIAVLTNKFDFDKQKVEQLLEQGKILEFAKQVENLSKVWFGNNPHTDLTLQIQDFILKGGLYGSLENKVAVGQVSKGGKFRYLLSRIWLNYNELKFQFPSLEKRRLLLPFYQVARWFKLIFCGGFRRSVKEISSTSKTAQSNLSEINKMMQELGLK